MAPVPSCHLWLHLRIHLGNLCDRSWQGKPSSPSGTLGSCGAGSRSCMAHVCLLQWPLPCDRPCANLPPPHPPFLACLIYYLILCAPCVFGVIISANPPPLILTHTPPSFPVGADVT